MGRAAKQIHWKHPDCEHNRGLCYCKSQKRYESYKDKRAPKK